MNESLQDLKWQLMDQKSYLLWATDDKEIIAGRIAELEDSIALLQK